VKKQNGRFSGLLKKGRELEPDVEGDPELQQSETLAAKKPQRDKGRSHPDNKGKYVSTTIYLDRDVHKQVKLAMIDDERELSELTEELLRTWLERRKPSKL
jgi:hypothetical protein